MNKKEIRELFKDITFNQKLFDEEKCWKIYGDQITKLLDYIADLETENVQLKRKLKTK